MAYEGREEQDRIDANLYAGMTYRNIEIMALQEEKYGVQLLSFKEWILNESLENYVHGGEVILYRFGRDHGPVSVANPKFFGEHPFTQNDVKTSGIPRVFFYVDLGDKEQFFTGSTLYKTTVPAD